MINTQQIDLLIKEGEGLHLEFKERFTPRIDEDMVAFANTKGGVIVATNPGGLPDTLDTRSFGRVSIRRNELIADLFHRMDKGERAGTGIRRMNEAMKAAGQPQPEFSFGTFCTITFKRPDYFATQQVTREAEAQVEAQVAIDILRACQDMPLSSAEIATALGHKQLSGNLRKVLPRLREAGLLEYMIPDKPTSRLQRYRLTEKGSAVLARLSGDETT